MEVERRGHEGLVAKDEASLYFGGRTLSWLKVKQTDYRLAGEAFGPADLVDRPAHGATPDAWSVGYPAGRG
jgi:ATP-dependent DNA ligase